MRKAVPAAERFWSKVCKGDGCWEWTGAKQRNGYGSFGITSRRSVLAHRFAWMLANECNLSPTTLVCHRCDNRSCVRPDHLFLGTFQDNSDDCTSKLRQAHGERNGRARLTTDDVEAIRTLYASGRATCAALAAVYGLCHQQIQDICRGRYWKNAPGPISSPYRKAERGAE